MNLFNLFKLKPDDKRDHGQLFEKISALGEQLTETEIKQVTAVAGLCGRVAYADTEITADEIAKISGILKNESKLSPRSIEIVTTLLVEHRVELLTLEEYFYSRLADESMTEDEKRALLKDLFRIAAADGTICLQEENLLYTIAAQLKLSRKDVAAMKREFKDFLSVFQNVRRNSP